VTIAAVLPCHGHAAVTRHGQCGPGLIVGRQRGFDRLRGFRPQRTGRHVKASHDDAPEPPGLLGPGRV